jgi:hypothetical protein
VRRLLAVLVIGHALACITPAWAEPQKASSPPVENIDEADALRFELAQARLAIAQRDMEDARVALVNKYKPGAGDVVDISARKITRKAKDPKR